MKTLQYTVQDSHKLTIPTPSPQGNIEDIMIKDGKSQMSENYFQIVTLVCFVWIIRFQIKFECMTDCCL